MLKDNLKMARMKSGKTLEEVAKIVGVSRQTIQRYESGVINNIPSDKIEKLAEVLNTTPAYLMGWKVEPVVNALCNFRRKKPKINFVTANLNRDEMNLLLAFRSMSNKDKELTKAMIDRFDIGQVKSVGLAKPSHKILPKAGSLKVAPTLKI